MATLSPTPSIPHLCRRGLLVTVALGALLTGTDCASTKANTPVTTRSKSGALMGLWRHPADPSVLAWVSSPWTFSTTSYAIEGDDGLILIDTQFLARDTEAFVAAVEGATGKKVQLAVVLHANPDKFNGTAWLQGRGIEVVASAQVAALIPDVHAKRLRAFGTRYAPWYPTTTPAPTSFGDSEVTIERAGVRVRLIPTGAGCSAAHTFAVVDTAAGRHLFAGDLLANGSHSWLELGEVDAWRERLFEMRQLNAKFLHPGRGLSGGVDLIDAEETYLDVVTAAVDSHRGEPNEFEAIREDVVDAYPDLRFPVFLNLGIQSLGRSPRD